MANIRIFTDSCSDLGKEVREKYGIDYVKMCTVRGGVEKPADLNWPDYSPKEFYDILRGGERVLTTQVPAAEFTSRFTEAIEANEEIVYVGCALPMSSSVNTGAVVAKQLKEKYPDAVIHCIDSTNCSGGEGMLAVYAATLRNEGKSTDEIVAAVEERKHLINQYVTVGSLDMLKKAGRVKGSAAFFGNLLGVKPIIISDYPGQNIPITKVKGRRASLDELIRLTKESVIDPAGQTAFLTHADCSEEDVQYLRDKLINEVGVADVYVSYIGPIVGASIGPGAVGVWTVGKPVTMNKPEN